MANCIKCGAELMPGAVYCHACGKKQVAEKRKVTDYAIRAGKLHIS